MIEVIGNEIYRIATCLENALGREPTMKDYKVFEEKAEKALNDIIAEMATSDTPEPKTPAVPPTKEWTRYAYLRPDLVEEEEMPPLNDIDRDEELFLPRDLMTTRFPCLQPDELDYQEYNMLIILPDGKMYGAKTIDFEFEDIPK